jgi:two-component system nitrate/nitrite response regulator NarL
MSGVLTQRQMEILLLLAEGKTLPEMAAELYLSEHTVKSHRKTLFAALGAKNAAGAVACAYQRGILRAPERRDG